MIFCWKVFLTKFRANFLFKSFSKKALKSRKNKIQNIFKSLWKLFYQKIFSWKDWGSLSISYEMCSAIVVLFNLIVQKCGGVLWLVEIEAISWWIHFELRVVGELWLRISAMSSQIFLMQKQSINKNFLELST